MSKMTFRAIGSKSASKHSHQTEINEAVIADTFGWETLSGTSGMSLLALSASRREETRSETRPCAGATVLAHDVQ